MKPKVAAHSFIFLANVFYGLNYSIGQYVLRSVSPNAIVFTRVTFSLLLFYLVHKIFIKEQIEKKDRLMFIICGFFGVACNQLLFFTGLKYTSQIHASLLMICTPLLVLLLGWLIKKQTISFLQISGVFIGAIGVFLLILNKQTDDQSDASLFGDLCIILNAASYAIFLILAKPLLTKYSPFTISVQIFFYGCIFIFPFTINDILSVPWAEVHADIYYGWAYIILFATFLAYLFNTLGLHFGNATLVSIYIYTQPLIAACIAVLSGNEQLDKVKIMAGLCICIGVACVSLSGKINTVRRTASGD